MITITDNGNNSITFDRNGQESYLQKTKIVEVDAVNEGVMLRMKSGRTIRIDSYTEVSGATSANQLAEDINSMISGSCPSITLGDLEGSPYGLVGGSVEGMGAFITGGEGPYNFNVTGDLPGGVSGVISILPEESEQWAWIFTGHNFTTFGSFTFTLEPVDNNGCVGTPKEYTVIVGYAQEQVIPVPFVGGLAIIDIDVDDPALAGLELDVDAYISNLKFSASLTSGDLTFMEILLNDSLGIANGGMLSGTEMTDTQLSPTGVGLLQNGTPPYSGTYLYDFAGLGGFVNQTYSLKFTGAGTEEGDISYFSITILPM